MSSTGGICRFCLKTIKENEFSPLDLPIIEKAQQLISGFKLTSSPNPIICNTCKSSLESSHKLKRSCSSGTKFIKFLRKTAGITQPLELKELLKGSAKKLEQWLKEDPVCRVCLKANKDNLFMTTKDARSQEYGNILSSCLSISDENLTINPVICKLCIDVLQNMHTFINQLINIENQIKSYNQKVPSDSIDLLKLLDYIKMDEQNFHSEYDDKVPIQSDQTSNNVTPTEPSEAKKRQSPDQPDENSSKKQCIQLKNSCEITEHETKSSVKEESDDLKTDIDEIPYFEFSTKPIFVPYKLEVSIKTWMKQVEEFKVKHQMSDTTMKYKILGMMKKLPDVHSWFSSVADIYTWGEWKEKLVNAFPDENDYYTSVLRMVKSKTKPSYSFVRYYQQKMPLIKRLTSSNEEAISCLLGGLTNSMVYTLGRIGQYKTPEELLEFFKVCDEKKRAGLLHKDELIPSTYIKSGNKKNKQVSPTNSDHFSDSLYSYMLQNISGVKNDEGSSDVSKIADKIQDVPNVKCSCCDQKGHSSLDCPLTKTPEKPKNENQKSNIIVHENIVVSPSRSEKSKIEANTIQTDQPHEEDKNVAAKSGQKCVCCDKLGHSSMDCPLIKNKPTAQEDQCQEEILDPPSSDKPNEADVETNCSFCDKPGHSSLVCPLINTDTPSQKGNIRIVLNAEKTKSSAKGFEEIAKDDLVLTDLNKGESTKQTQQSVASKEKCFCCNKMGHTSLNCPLLPPNQAGAGKQTTQKDAGDQKRKVAQKKKVAQAPSKCSACNKLDHTVANCPLTRVEKCNITKKSTDQKNKVTTVAQQKNVEFGSQIQKVPQKSQKCLNCDRRDHSTVNCRLVKTNKGEKTNQIAERVIETQKNEDRGPQNKTAPRPRCLSCNKMGHLTENCWKKNKVNVVQSQDQNKKEKTVRNQSIVSVTCQNCNKTDHTTVNCPLVLNAPKDINQHRDKKRKCMGCNQSDHVTVNCPLINNDKSSATTTRNVVHEQKNNSNAVKNAQSQDGLQKCVSCNNLGHLASNCPFVNKSSNGTKSARNVVEDQKNKNNSTRVERTSGAKNCKRCNNSGHVAADCPQSTRYLVLQNIADRSNKSTQESRKNEDKKQESRGQTQSVRRCICCNNVGHSGSDCPLRTGRRNKEVKPVKPKVDESRRRSDQDRLDLSDKTRHRPDQGRRDYFDRSRHGSDQDAPRRRSNQDRPRFEREVIHVAEDEQNCSLCNKPGHTRNTCTFSDFFSGSDCKDISSIAWTDPSASVCEMEELPRHSFREERMERIDDDGRYITQYPNVSFVKLQRPMEDDEPPQKRGRMDPDARCHFCYGFGHSSEDCFRQRFEESYSMQVETPIEFWRPQEEDQYRSSPFQRTPVCEFCNVVGHMTSECFLARFENQYNTGFGMGASMSRQCLFCGKFGHSQLDCPKNNKGQQRRGGYN